MDLPFTGERPVPGAMPNLIFEGVIARYVLAANCLDGLPGNLLLDVGCGTGVGSGFLAFKGMKVIGVDPDFESLQWGENEKWHPDLILFQGQGESLPFEKASFQAVTAFECLEHMKNPLSFISEARRVLKPEGLLICSVPHCLEEVMSEVLSGESNPYHVQRFTPQTLRALLSDGFAVRAEWGQRFHPLDRYTYLLVNHLFWRLWKNIPWIGEKGLRWRQKRSRRLGRAGSPSEAARQTDYDHWREERIPEIWKPQPIEAEVRRIPETMIFLATRK